MASVNFTVEGMTCPHCQKAVEMALKTLEGVQNADVNLQTKQVTIEYSPEKTSEQALKDAIINAGYQVS